LAVALVANTPLLEVRDLAIEFPTRGGTVHAVNRVSFDVQRGEIVGLVGETGCGKSVTARALIGLTRSPGRLSSGTIAFEGEVLGGGSAPDWRRIRGSSVALVPQNAVAALNPVLRIGKQFENALRAHGRGGPSAMHAARDMLGRVGISDPDRVLRSYAHELSGGMAQRVVIGMATILAPRMLIADEPTSSLDLTIQRQILDLLSDLSRRESLAILVVTHDLGVVAQYCERVLVMYAGKIVEHGPVLEVMRAPAHPYTRALVAAIPVPGQRPTSLRGSLPDLVNYPPGCPFRDRCDMAVAECASVEPPLLPNGPRMVACHVVNRGSGGTARLG